MPGRKNTKKTTRKAKSAATGVPARKKMNHKEMRFSISLVILIGMLTFSMMLLLFTLNQSSTARAGAKKAASNPVVLETGIQKSKTQFLDDNRLEFKLNIPAQMGKWFYKIGQVKSPTDDTLADQYLKIFIPVPGSDSSNFDNQYQDVLTIRKFTADEWSDIKTACKKDKQDICEAGGQVVADTNDSVYAYAKPEGYPKNIEAKCVLADKILESFQLK